MPVLECISVIPTPRERRRRFLSRAIWTPVLTVLVLTLLTTGLLAYSSLARPALYQSTIQKFDRLFDAISIGEMLEDGAA